MKIAINGFGRIGKTFLRTLFNNQSTPKLDVAAINIGPGCEDLVAALFKYDSIMGTFQGKVSLNNSHLEINGHKIKVLAECDPEKIDWGSLGIEWVVEATGRFTTKEAASLHIKSGAKKVLITAPAHNEDVTIIPGVNDASYNPEKHNIISLGSCTSNCFAPMVKVVKENFSLKSGFMTTTHSYTNDQVLLDIEHSDPRRARAAAINIIPTKTGAQKVITKIYPELEGKISASAIRVPTPTVSIIDFTFELDKSVSKEEINNAFKKAASGELKGVVAFSEEALVSSDYKGNTHSCIIDGLLTNATGNLGKLFGWYDNEWGYCERLKDFLLHNK